ncbi:molybdopterin-dependent oxidoreductase [Sutterella sp.]|uniref:molybdopterin-containing oxidoreductase family protein n=1 Tax=Sutterella sp. TaxID=1981025 RepID=UPI0026E10EED|nr:molybdopterin-dependent oxidoreductase [Sutterella sp.]MDO5532846.1 molybdopterin-dependent oxidoreductase [Sutterella sp.]
MLELEGWEARPAACMICGGQCGLLVLKKKGEPVSQGTVRIEANPTHPQRGCCGRGAQAMWTWNHPLRLKKPMKRTGPRGSGQLTEVSWDQALDDIAARIRAIVEQDGERAVAMTSHNFSALQEWLAAPLGTPNVISHSSTCNSASSAGRRMVFGRGFDGPGRVEPDYARVKYLLCIGRTLNCAVGVTSSVSGARDEGAQVVFVDPRKPGAACGDAEWVPIRPGTDAAFILSLIHVGVAEGLVDTAFLTHRTNAPYLVEAGTHRPLAAAELIKGAAADAWAVMDARTGAPAAMALARNDKGVATGFDEPEGVEPVLDFAGEVTAADGRELKVESCFHAFGRVFGVWTPERGESVTGIPAGTITRIAREFFTRGGVCDDGWYGSRNGNDTRAFALMSMLNLFTGTLDQPGGFVVTQGAGYAGPSVSQKAGKGRGPHGETWTITEPTALDRRLYPEGGGTFSAIFDAIEKGDPYPIRAVFITGTTMFHREANSERLAQALKSLDLLVVQDILPHEVVDYADYVLPCTFFLETRSHGVVRWALDGSVALSDPGIDPPEGCEAREEIWQYCEILRRAFPERARERLGCDREIATRTEFKAWYGALEDAAWEKFLARKDAEMPGEGERIRADVEKEGWALAARKRFGVFPWKRPFGTPTGKPEILSFLFEERYGETGASAFSGLCDWEPPPGYTLPRPGTNEFYLVTGKDSASGSGAALFSWPTKFLGDRTVWMNPRDAERLGIRSGDTIELTGIDTGAKGRSEVTVTERVVEGALFAHGFSGGVRTKRDLGEFEFAREGVNTHWFATGSRERVTGALANNSSVRVERV